MPLNALYQRLVFDLLNGMQKLNWFENYNLHSGKTSDGWEKTYMIDIIDLQILLVFLKRFTCTLWNNYIPIRLYVVLPRVKNTK